MVKENAKCHGRGITKTSLTLHGTHGHYFFYNQPQAESGVVAIQLCLAHLPFTLKACTGFTLLRALSWLIRLFPWRSGFSVRPIYLGFVRHKVAVRQVFLRVFGCCPVSIMPPLLLDLFLTTFVRLSN
jgi:hypothetical protein